MSHILQRWLAEAGVLDPATPAPTGVAIVPAPASQPGDPAAVRYAEAALRREAATVAGCPPGGRNHALNRAAFSLEQLVAAGYLDAGTVAATLTAAGQTAGLADAEISRTLRSGARAGATRPRAVTLDPERAVRPAFTLLPGGTDADDTTAGAGAAGAVQPAAAVDPFTAHLQPGGSYLLDTPLAAAPVWGDAEHVLWAAGESLMIVGPPGVGKSTIAQQLTLARVGLTPTFLGWPVQHTTGRVLYLAMDRPRQIARSMRRMVTEDHRQQLDDRLTVWEGPLPYDVASLPTVLVRLAELAGADTIVVDSLKDAATGLVDSERAGQYNRARQFALAAGIEMVEIAHQRKNNGDHPPKTLADVHGGMEITAGAGSVFLVWGDAGDPIVEFRHLKQPADVVGPLDLSHDAAAGVTTLLAKATPVSVLAAEPTRWWTALEVATACQDGHAPKRAGVERVRRLLDRLVAAGSARRLESDEKFTATQYTYREPTTFGPSESKDA